MPKWSEVIGSLDPAQAAELAQLVDLEARWENLRTTPSRTPDVRSTAEDLHNRQQSYAAFRARLAAYNQRHAPAHVPELLLNTPLRLGLWCRRMHALFRRVPEDLWAKGPVHLLEKAYRRADAVAVKLGTDPIPRARTPDNLRDVLRALEALAQWCEDLATAPREPMAVTDAEPPPGLCA
jgi:hypothetical protein